MTRVPGGTESGGSTTNPRDTEEFRTPRLVWVQVREDSDHRVSVPKGVGVPSTEPFRTTSGVGLGPGAGRLPCCQNRLLSSRETVHGVDPDRDLLHVRPVGV